MQKTGWTVGKVVGMYKHVIGSGNMCPFSNGSDRRRPYSAQYVCLTVGSARASSPVKTVVNLLMRIKPEITTMGEENHQPPSSIGYNHRVQLHTVRQWFYLVLPTNLVKRGCVYRNIPLETSVLRH